MAARSRLAPLFALVALALLLNWLSRETPKNPTVLVAQGSALVPTEPLSAMVSSHEMQLLSAGQLVHASAHGNLAAPSVITRATPPLATHEAWLTDRWQAARDMSGTPLAGTQWVTLELESGCIAHRAVLDWETARADDYELQLRWHDRTMRADAVKSPWETLNVTRTSRNFSHQHA
jgi:hypothetical protein